jgi:hypothetical protein
VTYWLFSLVEPSENNNLIEKEHVCLAFPLLFASCSYLATVKTLVLGGAFFINTQTNKYHIDIFITQKAQFR